MNEWQLWTAGEVLEQVTSIQPRLDSWDRAGHPSQIRLRQYLQQVAAFLKPVVRPEGGLYLHMEIGVTDRQHLLHHHDVENYLAPLFRSECLGWSKFRYVSGVKRLGKGSSITIGVAQQLADSSALKGWASFSYQAGSGVSDRKWKMRLREALSASQPRPLPTGPVDMVLVWRCSAQRNWASLWKPTIDAMGPVLGEDDPKKPFSPNDDRIVSLSLHRTIDPAIGHDIVVGMWWRPAN